MYDVILVDEAQDFSKYFLQMCYMSLPHESRMLVYAYDELQSLDNKNVESPEDTDISNPDPETDTQLKKALEILK